MSTATVARAQPAPVAARRPGGLRPDIQALRALAVLGVVVYHLWPSALPGGFVGVDVFFVISGFLITSHLLKSPPTRVRDFAAFWARRIIRLLPPVFVVILATLAGVILFLPQAQWAQLAREAVTSMFYVQNWQLISDATDYLDAHRALSPFQHFWSLSVEEQYYIAWPFVVALVTWLGLRTRLSGPTLVLVGFGTVAAASFALSVVQTTTSPAEAYFSTWTRMWELAIGSMLAACFASVSTRLSVPQRCIVLWLGLGGIALAYTLIDGQTPFPGYAAALPTIATALVILANDPTHPLNPRRIAHARPTQMVGDCSYALYLWHWPLIIIGPYAVGHDLGVGGKLAVLGLALIAAWASTRLIEERVRAWPFLKLRIRRAFVMGVVLSAGVLVAGLALKVHVEQQVAESGQDVRAAMRADIPCLGAAAMEPDSGCDIEGEKLLTTPAYAKADVTQGIRKCLNWPPFKATPISCSRGDTDRPTKRIALFGNSHAGHWTEALSRLGKKNHWQVDTYIMGACFSSVDAQSPDCTKIVGQAVDRIRSGEYDAVVMATYDVDPNSTKAMYERTIDAFTESGAGVLVIRDTPAPWDQDNEPADCVAQHLDDVDACAGTPADWISPDLLHAAATSSSSPDVSAVDLNKYLCTKSTCPAVIGGMIVFSDYNHLSRTFSRTLAPYLEPALVDAVR